MLTIIIYSLYPNSGQASRLFHYLQVGRSLYNHSLEQRIAFYKEEGKTLSNYDQTADLTILRSVSQVLANVPVEIERDALRRLDRAFQNFFRRTKEQNGKAGFPRFKSANRWNSFSISNPGKVLRGNRIRISGVDGLVRARNIREPSGKIKEQRIVHRAGKWFCQLVVDDGLTPPPVQPVKSAIGIDMGLKSFAVFSNGEEILNPRFQKKLERKLARTHRALSRTKKGSHNRGKAIHRLQRVYLKITNQRWNFTHYLSKRIVSENQLIAVEKLNIAGMAQSRLAKSILDAAWGQFLWQLNYKAAKAGVLCLEVDPKGTSQDCSGCGQRVQKDLSVRVHSCPHCGLQLDRDHNAALNILQRALSAPVPDGGISKACGAATGPQRNRKPLLAETQR